MELDIRAEHRWLQRLAGHWRYENECRMAPDQPPMTFSGTETVRMLGEVWAIGEGTATLPDGSPGTTQIAFGFDPVKNCFVGTFIGSMMTHLWLYDRGTLDASGKALTLLAEGPNCMSPTQEMARFRDIMRLEDDDTRVMTSEMLQPDGTWNLFMTGRYTRIAG